MWTVVVAHSDICVCTIVWCKSCGKSAHSKAFSQSALYAAAASWRHNLYMRFNVHSLCMWTWVVLMHIIYKSDREEITAGDSVIEDVWLRNRHALFQKRQNVYSSLECKGFDMVLLSSLVTDSRQPIIKIVEY